MFGLFKKPLGNEEQLDLIFNMLIDLRTSFRSDDRQYNSALSDMPKWMNLKCDAINKKMTSGQRAYVDFVGVVCKSNVEIIRRNVDQILAILDTIDHHATPDMTNLKSFNQKAQLQTLRNEIESIFMAAMKSGRPH